MCTLLVMNRVHERYPLLIAANRDEFYSRKSIAPACINEEPVIWAGQDERAGGTWLGVTKGGFFVGITNQRSSLSRKENVQSRGQVVLEALAAGCVEAVCDQLSRLKPSELNPFNLLFGNAEQLKVAYCHDGMDAIEIADVPEGVHVLPNGRLNDPHFPKAQRCRSALQIDADSSWSEIQQQCLAALSSHEKASPEDLQGQEENWNQSKALLRELDAVCVHAGVYGTCSASIVALRPGEVAEYWFSEGAPCQNSFNDMLPLLKSS